MKNLKAAAVAALMTLGTVPMGSIAQGTMSPEERLNMALVNEWGRVVIEAARVSEAERYMAADYIQHNPMIETGRDAFVRDFGRRPPREPLPEMSPAPVVEFAKGPYVLWVFEREAKDANGATYKFNSFDLFRIENGKVAEHWGGRPAFRPAPVPGQPAHAAVEQGIGPKPARPRNSAAEQQNEDIANVLLRDILQYGHLELAEQVMAPGYIQHNPNLATGRRAFVEFFGKTRAPEPLRAEWKDEPELVITSGNIVLYMFKRFSADPSNRAHVYKWNWFDMVRVDGGLVREHWDSAVKIPPPATVPMPAGFREYR